ncbi:adaptin ear-binding coat-associated protein 1 [Limosa lapponica baueri]|uniref:Adaptin ear-binding coat-associated protein 1 n=1 Tax=Limosa lapponica baueri TaxID=1758121 RepID=A0A2I0USA0_LIMLA|nr:adaptin ear-binding coat-associated protein 1 [Limosa lapponica baueri]
MGSGKKVLFLQLYPRLDLFDTVYIAKAPKHFGMHKKEVYTQYVHGRNAQAETGRIFYGFSAFHVVPLFVRMLRTQRWVRVFQPFQWYVKAGIEHSFLKYRVKLLLIWPTLGIFLTPKDENHQACKQGRKTALIKDGEFYSNSVAVKLQAYCDASQRILPYMCCKFPRSFPNPIVSDELSRRHSIKCDSSYESGTQLKCLYTNARNVGNKQEELEAIVRHESYDVVAIMEMWWDESNDWSAAVEGYKLFRRDRQGRRGGGVALYVREDYECVELTEDNGRVECLWVRIRGRASKADIMVGVCYRPPNQEVEVDNIFYKQLAEVSRSLALVLVGDFNLPDISWAHNTAEREQSRRFLERVRDNFLTQLVREPTREGALLDLLFVNREGLVGDVMVGGCLGYSDHEMIEFLILREARRGVSRTAIMCFRSADFGLFKSLLDRVPWEAALKGKGVQEGWRFFREEVLKAQEQAVPVRSKVSRLGKRPAWLNKEISFLSNLIPEDIFIRLQSSDNLPAKVSADYVGTEILQKFMDLSMVDAFPFLTQRPALKIPV